MTKSRRIMAKDEKISIHTPAKGVTYYQRLMFDLKHISIHTPAKGVTPGMRKIRDISADFNPHSREGSD